MKKQFWSDGFLNLLGVKNTSNKRNALMKIEVENYPHLWIPMKKRSHENQIPFPMIQETSLFISNDLQPRFFLIAEKLGMDKIETSKNMTIALSKFLDMLIENNQIDIILNTNKEQNFEIQGELLNLISIPVQHQ